MPKNPDVNPTSKVVPMIYSYITPGVTYHDGWSKIGYTERDVDARIKEQTHTAGLRYIVEWKGLAVYDDGSGDTFKDRDFHAYLRKNGIEQMQGEDNEWFHIVKPESQQMFFDFKSNRGVLDTGPAIDYVLRPEQEEAVKTTENSFEKDEHDEFLWNAKPRFGKTLSVYDLCKRLNARNVLIVTNRPAVANSWYSDYRKFMGTESGYMFVTDVPDLKERPYTVSREDLEWRRVSDPGIKCLEFVSLQDLKGSIYFGGKFDKLRHIVEEGWDLLVIDEAHEGIDTLKTDVAFDHIKRKWTLHLTGTPFKALASGKFPKEAIYNWTYLDEQKAKESYSKKLDVENPYSDLPKLTMLTYKMSDIVSDEASRGIDLNGETVEYAFDLNEFFATDGNGKFVHDADVDRFLDALTTQARFPFSSPELRDKLKHTLWLLDRVDSAKSLARKLKAHPVFGGYEIVVAAGDGRLDADDMEGHVKAFDRVVKAIKEHDKTITLSVGQLTTGVTVPEWTGILILSNLRSPAQYMQAAFRVQNPCLFNFSGQYYRKENAYIFDFDPARTLDIYEKFANDLSTDTYSGRGSSDERKEHIRELLNFFPVLGEDKDGVMEELDAEQILLIPRKIRSLEVVRRGFMSDFLFQNIGRIFNAPQQTVDIIYSFTPVKDKGPLTQATLFLDDNGEIDIPQEIIIGKANDLFGPKIYGPREEDIEATLKMAEDHFSKTMEDDNVKRLKNAFLAKAVGPALDVAKEHYGEELTPSITKNIERKIGSQVEITTRKAISEIDISRRSLDAEKNEKLKKCATDSERASVEEEYHNKKAEKTAEISDRYKAEINDITQSVGTEIVGSVMTRKQEKEKDAVESTVRDHLRGFSRTIPSFLMAYGDDSTTLENFDTIVPENVFKEVTGISIEQFRFLRDGGDYTDEETEDNKHFDGQLFDPVVFDDSVKEFLSLKKKLADWFDESQEGDIFDYIPPQKTNQIFTPRKVVKDMVDMLEEENPGCFDDEKATFADLYMKSGLYIAEIVKRLYRSDILKRSYPNPADRLNHIFSEQVYGLAPTEIIYRIVRSFLLGFNDEVHIKKDNIRLCDSLKFAKDGDLEEGLKKVFSDTK